MRIILLTAFLAGCGSYNEPWQNRFDLHVDQETGCEYLSKTSSASSLTPRVASDGVSHKGCAGG